ncbi:MAG: RluA family pseudouridine synthase [Spirochaetes bacterium]|jgi:23S rRNA pseudouridine1911/1915/1917 synthase|nr:RluA family pseudouridine synthase [Spirochaetota bacterium]
MRGEPIEIIIPGEGELERIDRFLSQSLEMELSRSLIQNLLRHGHITVNGEHVRPNYRLKTDDAVSITFPEPEKLDLEPQDIPLDILYEDGHLAVINKPAGLVVHPGPGNRDGTLVNALLHHLRDLSSIGGVERPGIVHRLDKDTAGVMVIAKTDQAHRFLSEAFAGRNVVKRYLTVSAGKPQAEHMIIDSPIGRHPKYRHKMSIREDGRAAVTELFLKKVYHAHSGVFSVFDILIHTGRTHQIRVHLSSTGLPVIGDPIYSKKWEKYRVPHLLLASVYLEFAHPVSGKPMRFGIDPPAHIVAFIKRLEKETAPAS